MPSSTHQKNAQICRWHSFASSHALEQAATQAILHAAQAAIAQRGAFHLVLAGGTTPRHLYENLRQANSDWPRWHIYYGDERCLPADHAERNSVMANQAWLAHVAIPQSHVHPIPAESGNEVAARQYAKTVEKIPQFDLVLLGLGEDGHTASLFPDHEWGDRGNAPAALAVNDAPKPPAARVSLSAQRLSATRQLIFLVTGRAKKQAVEDWQKQKNIPATAITPDAGVDIYIADVA